MVYLVTFAGSRLHTLVREQYWRPSITIDVAGPSVFFVLTSVAMLLPAAVIDLMRRVATRREVAPPNALSTSEPNVAVVLDC